MLTDFLLPFPLGTSIWVIRAADTRSAESLKIHGDNMGLASCNIHAVWEPTVSLRIQRPCHSGGKAKRHLISWRKVKPASAKGAAPSPHTDRPAGSFICRALFQPHLHESVCCLWWVPIHSHRPWSPVSGNALFPTGGTLRVPSQEDSGFRARICG